MKKMKNWIKQKQKKKGFTLVELLAVMVVLSLILVLVAPNVLNSMNNSKKNAMVIYAKKMISTAKENVEGGKLSGDITSSNIASTKYMIKGTLATDQDQYVGCVVVGGTMNSTTYTINIVDKGNGLSITGQGLNGLKSTANVNGNATATTDAGVSGCS